MSEPVHPRPASPAGPPEPPQAPRPKRARVTESGRRGLAGGPSGLVTWGPWLAVGGTVFSLVIGLLLALPLVAVHGDDPSEFGPGATSMMQLMTGAGFLLAPLLLATFTALSRGVSSPLAVTLRRLGLVAFRIGSAVKWIVIAVVSYLAFAITWAAIFGEPVQDDIASRFGPMWQQVLLIAVLAPIAEEVCFRGFLFGGLRTRFSFPVAALLAGIIFGLLHYSTGWSTVPQLAVLGIVFCLIYEKTGSLWPAVALHAVNNLLALTLIT